MRAVVKSSLAYSSSSGNLWGGARCTCCLVYPFPKLSWFWALGLPPLACLILACLILAQFIDCAVSAVSWTPDSFHFAWMSTVVAWGLVSSSWDSYLWIEWSWLVYLGLSNSSLAYLGSEPYACCCFGSVLCLRCSCGVLDLCQFLSSLDECHSYMLTWPHHPALVTFGWYCHFLCFFSSTGLCVAYWRRPLGVRIPFFHLFTCGTYSSH